MLMSRAIALSGVLLMVPAALAAQAPAAAPTTAAPARTAAAPALTPMLQPSLEALQQALQGLRLDKWKGGSVRAEAERNISSITSDLENTLPPLLQAADADATSVTKMLPVSRNVDALYDVVLRVFDGARVVAPSDQAAQIQQAMSGLETARHSLEERLQAAASVQERQIGELHATLRAQIAPVCPVQPAPSCPTPPAKKAVRRRAKPAAKPAPAAGSSTNSSSTPSTPAKPNQ